MNVQGPNEASRITEKVDAMWALHPVQTAAITYLSQRAESLMGLFYLLTLYAFIRAHHSIRPKRWQFVSVICCWAAIGTKEVALTAPILVLLFDRAFLTKSF